MQYVLFFFGGIIGLGGLQYLILAPNAQGMSNGKNVQIHGIGSRVLGLFLLMSAACFIYGGVEIQNGLTPEQGIIFIIPAFFFLGVGFVIATAISQAIPYRPNNRPDWTLMSSTLEPPKPKPTRSGRRRDRPDYDIDYDHDYDVDYDID